MFYFTSLQIEFHTVVKQDLAIYHHAQGMNPEIVMVVPVTPVVVPSLTEELALVSHHLDMIDSV